MATEAEIGEVLGALAFAVAYTLRSIERSTHAHYGSPPRQVLFEALDVAINADQTTAAARQILEAAKEDIARHADDSDDW